MKRQENTIPPPFKLERLFAKYEFQVKYLLSPSDCEALTLDELLAWSDPDSLERWRRMVFSYTESQGDPVLRSEIARGYEQITPEQILIAVPEEAIFIAMNTLLDPGDHVIALFPAYQSLYELALTRGCELDLWTFQQAGEGWELDLRQFEKLLRPETRMLVLNFPHNPTGFHPSRTQVDEILKIAADRGLIVFSDEMYRSLEYEEEDKLPALCDIYRDAVSLSGLSKAFALPGLRIGWLASNHQEWIDRWLAFKDYTTICSSAPSEILGIMALRAKEKILERNLSIVKENLVEAGKFFNRYPEYFEWLPPQAGSVAFPRWVGPMGVDQFCQEVLNQEGILIIPGSIFDYPGQYFRVGLGRRNFPEVLVGLERYLAGIRG